MDIREKIVLPKMTPELRLQGRSLKSPTREKRKKYRNITMQNRIDIIRFLLLYFLKCSLRAIKSRGRYFR
jgi:hypothetical protein